MYSKRLLSLARHLGKDYMNEVLFKKRKQYGCAKAGSNIEHFHWALAVLPKVAPTQ